MKTYPYQDGDKLIQLVERRELDQLLERLAEARESHLAASARDVQTIQRQAILLERMAGALEKMLYIIGEPSAKLDKLWRTDDEVNEAYHTSIEALAAYESANPEPGNPCTPPGYHVETEAMREKLLKVEEAFQKIIRSVPACVNGFWFWPSISPDGDYLGEIPTDPDLAIQEMQAIAETALTQLQNT